MKTWNDFADLTNSFMAKHGKESLNHLRRIQQFVSHHLANNTNQTPSDWLYEKWSEELDKVADSLDTFQIDKVYQDFPSEPGLWLDYEYAKLERWTEEDLQRIKDDTRFTVKNNWLKIPEQPNEDLSILGRELVKAAEAEQRDGEFD